MDARSLLEFLRGHRLGVQASVSPAGDPQAAVVGFAITDRFEIVFDTLESTRKVTNLRHHSRAAFVVGGLSPGDERTAQVEGIADVPSGPESRRLKAAYYEVYPDGVQRAEWPGLVYVRIRPTWVRYSDFNRDPPELVEFTAEELVL